MSRVGCHFSNVGSRRFDRYPIYLSVNYISSEAAMERRIEILDYSYED